MKQDLGCSSIANANAEQTDIQVLQNILQLQQSFSSGEISENIYIRERTRLLNGLFSEGEMSGVR